MSRKLNIIFLLFLIIPLITFSQEQYLQRKITWGKNHFFKNLDNKYSESLYFDDALYLPEYNGFPVYYEDFSLENNCSDFIFEIINPEYKSIDINNLSGIKGLENISYDIKIKSSFIVQKKVHRACLYILPIRKNIETGCFEKLISFTIKITPVEKESAQSKNLNIYADSSVLAHGKWYKIKLNKTGVYKISYNDLISMGVDVENINPENIRIYGNGPGILPENNSEMRYDDLLENAIFVSGQEDGKFDNNDYILFYGQSQTIWKYNKFKSLYEHTNNLYSDYTYYFINFDLGKGKRIPVVESSVQPPDNYVRSFDDYRYYENDTVNLIKSGKAWYGEEFYKDNLNRNFSLIFPDAIIGSKGKIQIDLACESPKRGYFYCKYSNDTIISMQLPADTDNWVFAKYCSKVGSFDVSSPDINLSLYYKPDESVSIYNVWLNSIEITLKRNLKFNSPQFCFRDISSVGKNVITEFVMSDASPDITIWDVTDSRNIVCVNADIIDDSLKFCLPNDELREFLAFDNTLFYSVEFVKQIQNQNLHSLSDIDLVIVSHPDFLLQANKLAEFHNLNDGFNVCVTTPGIIYNEFSSGAQDISAIRDFLRMLYKKAGSGHELKYLILFGDASYDYKNLISDNTNFVPAFQSKESLKTTASFVTDDFYGLLDDEEGYNAEGNLDIGIGRLPVKTISQADDVINKIFKYSEKDNAQLRNWRNEICFVADDENGNLHLRQADEIASFVDSVYKNYNLNKIYLDAYKQISTPLGDRYPDVNKAISKAVNDGVLVFNYTGHGGETGLSEEKIMEISDILGYKNIDNLPLFITASCSFTRYDNPELESAGELLLLNPDGGAIGLFTTSRLAYSGSNFAFNKKIYKNNIFEKENGNYPGLGDVLLKAKTPSNANIMNIALMGDPALKIAYPKYNISTDLFEKINYAVKSTAKTDTVKALSKISVHGSIKDDDKNIVSDFNGVLDYKFYDKYMEYYTLGNDKYSYPVPFLLRDNVLLKGKAKVENGKFNFDFIIPKDIAYQYDTGKMSFYASDGTNDAKGYFNDFIIGGIDNLAPDDNTGPEISLFINDENFTFGGITNENPLLLAFVEDKSGINSTGLGIGHNIIAILDDNYAEPFLLNDYFQPKVNNFQKGIIYYQFNDLSEGMHSLKLKVFDVYNNVTEAYTEFIVNKLMQISLKNVENRPNPFKEYTDFYFTQNFLNENLLVVIKIYSLDGRLVKTLNKNISNSEFQVGPIRWNGVNEFGTRVDAGMYIYKIVVLNGDNISTKVSSKLIIVN